MTTAMGNPHYLPAVCIQVTIINFTVTFEGLQEQLLSSVVKQERPYLEMERSQLLERLANDLQLLRDLEDKSLSLLQKAEGNVIVYFVPYLYAPLLLLWVHSHRAKLSLSLSLSFLLSVNGPSHRSHVCEICETISY